MDNRMYKLKKSYQFKKSSQANAFLEIAGIYGKGRIFGSVVIYEASLEFIIWRNSRILQVLFPNTISMILISIK
jgi:hypothetical protein